MIRIQQKRKVPPRFDRELGLWITYQLNRIGESKQSVANKIHVSRVAVVWTSYNRSASRRIRQALADTLGYETWEALIDAFEKRKERVA